MDLLPRRLGADETSQQTIINRDSLELGKELGQGEFGSVLMGVWIDPVGKRVCVFILFGTLLLVPCFPSENDVFFL